MPMEISEAQCVDAPRLLVIDDDLVQRKLIARLGGQVGFVAAEAASFAEAETHLKQPAFDCITLDLSLGEQNGLMLLRTIVDSGKIAPIIVISGADGAFLSTAVSLAQSLKIEAVAIAKPLKLTALREALAQRYQSASSARMAARMSAAFLDATPSMPAPTTARI